MSITPGSNLAQAVFALTTNNAYNSLTNVLGNIDIYPGNTINNPSNLNQLRGTQNLGDSTAQTTLIQLNSLINSLNNLPAGTNLDGVNLADLSPLTSGTYNYTTDAEFNGILNLTGSSTDFFYFIFSANFTIDDNSVITKDASVNEDNIFWYVQGSLNVGVGTTLIGNFVNLGNITIANPSNLVGRLLTNSGAVTLNGGTFENNCIIEGTKIRILRKNEIGDEIIEEKIENLKIGDFVCCAGEILDQLIHFPYEKEKYVPIKYIYKATSSFGYIIIKKGVFEQTYDDKIIKVPTDDLELTHGHGILVDNILRRCRDYAWKKNVTNLKNGGSLIEIKKPELQISQDVSLEEQNELVYNFEKGNKAVYHIGVDKVHHSIWTNGMITESYWSK